VTTDLLLLFGVAAAVVVVAVVLIDGALRPGYDPTYHTVSELELGNRGWVQRANFLLMGAGGLAFGVGTYRALATTVGAVLLGIFGLGLLVAGILPPDAVRGYPPGVPSEPSTKPTPGALVHAVIGGPVAFLAIFGACLNIAAHLEGAWRLYTLLTAVCWPHYERLDRSGHPKRRSKYRTRTARPHPHLLDMDRGAGHSSHRRSALALA
jgi:Protein of unknown function (DUF998)